MTVYNGVLTFHSETGTEGGYWAFQDEKFMGLDAPPLFSCARCGRVWDKDRDEEPPPPVFTYWVAGDTAPDGTPYIDGFRIHDEYDPNGQLGSPSGSDAEYNRQKNEIARACQDEGHAEWKNMYPNGMWSYEGLHILHSGDHLVVKDGDEVLFSGVVALPPDQDPYADGAYAAGGYLTAHSRPPVGTNEEWWLNEMKAALTTEGVEP